MPKIINVHYPSPTIQKFLSGSGTYTTPSGVRYIKVRMVGGGGGGAGSGTTGGAGPFGGAGGATTFGTSLLTCSATNTSDYGGGGPGTPTISLPAIGTAIVGARGTGGTYANGSVQTTYCLGGTGGSSPFGGAGASQINGPGYAAQANTGSGGGGGGGGVVASIIAGGGGGAGGYIEATISAPSSTYSYAVGAGGTAGTATASGNAGGAGGSGYIEVTEFYE